MPSAKRLGAENPRPVRDRRRPTLLVSSVFADEVACSQSLKSCRVHPCQFPVRFLEVGSGFDWAPETRNKDPGDFPENFLVHVTDVGYITFVHADSGKVSALLSSDVSLFVDFFEDKNQYWHFCSFAV